LGIGAPHAEQIDELVPTITKSKERLDKIEPHTGQTHVGHLKLGKSW